MESYWLMGVNIKDVVVIQVVVVNFIGWSLSLSFVVWKIKWYVNEGLENV